MSGVNLAIPFRVHNVRNDLVSEFNVRFTEGRNSFEKFIDFINMYLDKRINVRFFGEFPMHVITTVDKLSDNIYVRLGQDQFMMIEELKNNGIKYFFESEANFTYNLSSLDSATAIGVTDIYPTDDLLYDLRNTKRFCDEHNINMRLVLNRIPMTTVNKGTDYKSQIYRPQDKEFLDEYFTTYEFDCGQPVDWAKFDVLYRAWFDRGGWNGDLEEINDDLQVSYPNLSVIPNLTNIEGSCERRCTKRINNPCDKCNQFMRTAISMANTGIYLKGNKRRTPIAREVESNQL